MTSKYFCHCGHTVTFHKIDRPHSCKECMCSSYNGREEKDTCFHISWKPVDISISLYKCDQCSVIGDFKFFLDARAKLMNNDKIMSLETRIKNLEHELSATKNILLEEKAKKVHDFLITAVPVHMMDSEVRDNQNTEHTAHTWVVGKDANGFRCRTPIRLMTDSHLKNVFGVFVSTPKHICYSEMKNEMYRRGLL